MKSRKVFVAVLFMLFTSLCFAQLEKGKVVGEVMSLEEGLSRFGTVTQEVGFETSKLSSLLAQVKEYVMFNIVNGKVVVLDDARNVLYPSGVTVRDEDVFHLYSKSKVQELINLGGSQETSFQFRGDVFTVVNGNTLLECSDHCPPICASYFEKGA